VGQSEAGGARLTASTPKQADRSAHGSNFSKSFRSSGCS